MWARPRALPWRVPLRVPRRAATTTRPPSVTSSSSAPKDLLPVGRLLPRHSTAQPYPPGSFFLHRTLGYRGVIVAAWHTDMSVYAHRPAPAATTATATTTTTTDAATAQAISDSGPASSTARMPPASHAATGPAPPHPPTARPAPSGPSQEAGDVGRTATANGRTGVQPEFSSATPSSPASKAHVVHKQQHGNNAPAWGPDSSHRQAPEPGATSAAPAPVQRPAVFYHVLCDHRDMALDRRNNGAATAWAQPLGAGNRDIDLVDHEDIVPFEPVTQLAANQAPSRPHLPPAAAPASRASGADRSAWNLESTTAALPGSPSASASPPHNHHQPASTMALQADRASLEKALFDDIKAGKINVEWLLSKNSPLAPTGELAAGVVSGLRPGNLTLPNSISTSGRIIAYLSALRAFSDAGASAGDSPSGSLDDGLAHPTQPPFVHELVHALFTDEAAVPERPMLVPTRTARALTERLLMALRYSRVYRATTEGLQITVIPIYDGATPLQGAPGERTYCWNCKVQIESTGKGAPMQLMSRWLQTVESNGRKTYVHGRGVDRHQPTLSADERTFQFVWTVMVGTPRATISGSLTFAPVGGMNRRGPLVHCEVPSFELQAPELELPDASTSLNSDGAKTGSHASQRHNLHHYDPRHSGGSAASNRKTSDWQRASRLKSVVDLAGNETSGSLNGVPSKTASDDIDPDTR